MANLSGKSPGWRSGNRDRSAEQVERSERSWRRPVQVSGVADQLAGERRRRLLRRIAVGLATLTCLVVAIVLIWLLRGTKTGIVVMQATEAAEFFPSNPHADHDLSALKSLTLGSEKSLFRSDPLELIEVEYTGELPKALQAFRDKDVLILYLNLLSGRDGQGPYLVPYKTRADDPSDYYRFDGPQGLWQTLKDNCRDKQQKLVVLDVAHVTADWRMGLLANDAVRNLQNVAKEYEIENLVILTSCRPGERSWTSTHLGGAGQSVFGHYLVRGLAGEADIGGDANVDLRELFEYVNNHTYKWVEENRDAAPGGQHPMLIADDAGMNFIVAEVVEGVKPAWPPADQALGEAEKQLRSLFKDRDKHLNDFGAAQAYWRDPLLWRQFTWQLRRAEERLLDGYADLTLLGEARKTLEVLRSHHPDDLFDNLDLEDELWANTTLHSNFAMHEAAKVTTQNAAERESWQPNFEHSPAPPERHADRFRGVKDALPEEHLRTVLSKDFPAHYPNGALRPIDVDEAVRTRRAGEMAANGPLGTWRWVEDFVWQGDPLRREGEDRLFLAGDSQTDPNVRMQLETAGRKLGDARDAYTTAVKIARNIHYAELVRARLLAELPELARWAAFRNPPQNANVRAARRQIMELFQNQVDPRKDARIGGLKGEHDLEARVLVLIAWTHELSTHLQAPSTRPGNVEPLEYSGSIREDAKQAEDLLLDTQARLKSAAEDLLDDTPDKPQYHDWRRVHGLLQFSLLNAELRGSLRERLKNYEEKLQGQLTARLLNETQENRSPKEGADPTPHNALWQAFWGLQVLSLAGHDTEPLWRDWNYARAALPKENGEDGTAADAGEVWDRLARLGDDLRGDPELGFASLDGKLRRHLERTVSEPIQARQELADAVRLARALEGYDASRVDNDPVEQLRNFDVARLCLTQADRFLEDYWARWYDRRVDECIKTADRVAGRMRVPFADVVLGELTDSANSGRGLKTRLAQRADRDTKSTVAGPPRVYFRNGLDAQIPLDVFSTQHVPTGIGTAWMRYSPKPQADGPTEPTLEGTRAEVSIAGDRQANVDVKLARVGSNGAEEPCKEFELKVPAQLWFRGHLADSEPADGVIVIPCPPKGIEERYRPPGSTGQLLLAGRDVRRPVVFVFDCSDSMKDPLNGRTKFEEARAALKEAIDTLRKNPPAGEAFRVALIVYGHRFQKLKRGGRWLPLKERDDWPNDWPGKQQPHKINLSEDEEHEVALSDVEILHRTQALGNNEHTRIAFILDSLRQWGNTPLNLALLKALAHTRGERGATIVAITDGQAMDGAYKDGQPKDRFARLQDELDGNSQFDVHIVGFALQNQLQIVQNFADDIGAQFHNAPDGAVLANRLMQALNFGHYSVLPDSDSRNEPIRRRLGQSLEFGPGRQIGSGRHTLQLPSGDKLPLPLDGGEDLRAELKFGQLYHEKYFGELGIRSGEAIQNQRIDEATPPTVGRAAPADAPTHLACRKFNVNSTARVAGFRFSVLHRQDDLFVRRPAEIFFEVLPKVEESAPQLRTVDVGWSDARFQSIPTWDIDVEDWPTGDDGEKAVVRAYWKMDRTAADVNRLSWDDAESKQACRLPGGGKFELSAEYQPQKDRAIVRLRLAPDDANDVQANDELAHLRVELGYSDRNREFDSIPLPYRSIFRKSDSLSVEFEVDKDFGDRPIWVAITSLEARKKDAYKAELNEIEYRTAF